MALTKCGASVFGFKVRVDSYHACRRHIGGAKCAEKWGSLIGARTTEVVGVVGRSAHELE